MHVHLSSEGKLFAKRLLEASKMSATQSDIFNQLSASFAPATVSKWGRMVTAWNANPKAPNPYAEPKGGTLSLILCSINMLIFRKRLRFRMFD